MFLGPEGVDPCKNLAAHGTDWTERIVTVIGAALVATFTYLLGTHQKTRDRQVAFYTESVVTPSMAEIDAFFESYSEKLLELAKNPATSGAGVTVPRPVTKCHTEFSEDLYALSNKIAGRLEAFDAKAVKRLANLIDELDDKVTTWLFKKAAKEADAVAESLLEAKRGMIQVIYKGNLSILK